MKDVKKLSIDRKLLYDEIWANSLHKTAIKYNVSDTRLKEACLAAQIPLPTLSYWGKKNMDMDVSADIVPLPALSQTMVEVILKTGRQTDNSNIKKDKKKEIISRQNRERADQQDKPKVAVISPTKGITVISRKELHEKIWELQNMDKAAKYYDIPITRLTAVCEASNIPLPTPSQMGDKYSRWHMKEVPLPESEQTEVKLYTRKVNFKGWQKEHQEYIQQLAELNHIVKEKPQMTARQLLVNSRDSEKRKKLSQDELLALLLSSPTLCSMDKDMRENVFRQALALPEKKSGKLHHDVISYRQSVETWENAVSYQVRNIVPANVQNIAKNTRKRMYGIMDLLVQSISAFGGRMIDGAFLVVGKDRIGIEFVEGTDEVPHVLTKEEAKKMAEYNDAKRWNRYASKPDIKKYDHPYNGLLRIRIGNTYSGEGDRISIGDSRDGLRLEDRMDEVLIAVFEKMELHRIRREDEEEKARIKEEEKRRAEENRQKISEEKNKIRQLISCARRHKIAMEIREYVCAMREAEAEDYTPEWAEWAMKKADWYDPVIKAEDELLGKNVDLSSEQEQRRRLYWNGVFY